MKSGASSRAFFLSVGSCIVADRRFACSEQKIGILLDHMEAGAENTSFEGSSDTHGGANFETQPPHNWKHESGISVSTDRKSVV